MTIASTSEVQLAFVPETIFGQTPATPAFDLIRLTSEDLTGTIATVVSAEIRADAEIGDLIKIGENGSGSMPFEMSFGPEWDTLFEHTFRNVFVSNAAVDTGVAALAVTADNVFTRTVGDFLTDGFEVGMDALTSGFTDPANNGRFLVVAVTATDLTVGQNTLVIEAEGADEQIAAQGALLQGGTQLFSSTFEKKHETGTPDSYLRYRGSRMGGMSLSATIGAVITGSFTLLGLDETTGDAEIAGSTYNPPNGNPVMSMSDVGVMYVEGLSAPVNFSEFTMALDNGARAQQALGSTAAIGIAMGTRAITGTINAYFDSLEFYDLAVNNAAVGVGVPFTDTDGNTYMLYLPKCKFTARAASTPAINQDVFANLSFQAIFDPSSASSIRLNASPAVP